MDLPNRRRQMTRLCLWLKSELKLNSGAALAQAIGVPQSSISAYFSGKPNASLPEDATKQLYVDFLLSLTSKKMRCDKWSVAEFTRYLDSNMEPEAFIKYLENKPIPIRMSVHEIHSSLTDPERLELVGIVIEDLKKNSHLQPCA